MNFFVQNTPDGQLFLQDFRRAVKKAGLGGVRVRGRNPNRKQFYAHEDRVRHGGGGTYFTMKSSLQQDLPLKFATYFYLNFVYEARAEFTNLANIYAAAGKGCTFTR